MLGFLIQLSCVIGMIIYIILWLDSPHDFDLSNFNSFIDGITASFQPPSSSFTGNSGSSSGGSSGGGLSGGGSGGGGGGSW